MAFETRLFADVCSDVSYGFTASATTEPIGPKFLRITDIQGGKVSWEEVPYCDADLEAVEKYALAAGDIVVARTGNSTGENTQILSLDGKAVFASYLIRFRVDGEQANPFFVGYQLRTNRFRDFVLSIRGGSAQPGANAKQLGRFDIFLLPRQAQDEAVKMLRALDDRIDNLRQTNATLQAIAAALFKSWFVDFDGVPREDMQESELGLIPKGWRVGKLEDLLVLQRGFDLPVQNRVDGEFPVIAAGGFNGMHHVAMVKGPGVVTGRSGVLGNVFLELGNFWPLNTTLWIKEFRAAKPCFSFELLRRFDFSAFNAGSAVPTLNRNHIHGLPQLIPPAKEVEAFESIALTMHQRVKENEQRVATLVTLRDTLLPRLISGRLRISEEARQIVEVTG